MELEIAGMERQELFIALGLRRRELQSYLALAPASKGTEDKIATLERLIKKLNGRTIIVREDNA